MAKHATDGRRSDSALDIIVAGLAAGAAGFVTFAMPDSLFSSIVTASGLPGLIAAAQPPLGLTARVAAVVAAAAAGFLLVWLLLRSLGGKPARTAGSIDIDSTAQYPRARRADAHPDAPLRQPLLAGRDLGEPAADRIVEVAEPTSLPAGELEDEPFELIAREADELLELSAKVEDAEPPAPEVPIPAVRSRPVAAPPVESEQNLSVLMQRLESGLARREASPLLVKKARPQRAVSIEAPPAAEVEQESEVDEEDDFFDVAEDLDVPDLRAAKAPPRKQAIVRPSEDSVPEPDSLAGHRLRNAIQDLERLASRGS